MLVLVMLVPISIPTSVGRDYFSESGVNSGSAGGFHSNDPLWDGKGCSSSSSCCSFNNSPYFIAERLSARQLILRRISEIVCMCVCMYRGVEVLCYWSQKCGAIIVFGAHAAHWRLSFPLKAFYRLPFVQYSHCEEYLYSYRHFIPFRVIYTRLQ